MVGKFARHGTKFITTYFQRIDHLGEFLRRLKTHFADAVMGATVSGIAIFMIAALTSLPHWAWLIVFVGAFFFAAYATWREEYLKNLGHNDEVAKRRIRQGAIETLTTLLTQGGGPV